MFGANKGSLVKGKTRRIGRCHSAPYSTNSSSQSSDEESDQVSPHIKSGEDFIGPDAAQTPIPDNVSSLLEDWTNCDNRNGGVMNDITGSYPIDDQIKQNIGQETRETIVQETNCSPLRKVSEVENCDESSLSGR